MSEHSGDVQLHPKKQQIGVRLLQIGVVVAIFASGMVAKQFTDNMNRAPVDSEIMEGQKKATAPESNVPRTKLKEVSNANITPVDPSGDGEAGTDVPGEDSPENQATDVASDGRTEYDHLIDMLDMKRLQTGTDYLLTIIRDKNTGVVTCLYDPSFSGSGQRFPVKESQVTDIDGSKVVAAQFSYNRMTHFQYTEQRNRKNYPEAVITYRVFLRGTDVMVLREEKYTPGEFYRAASSSISKLLPSPVFRTCVREVGDRLGRVVCGK